MFREKGTILRIIILGLASICLFVLIFCNSSLADTYVWQDFEYWDTPRNHGWISSSPAYPVFGFGPYTGFGQTMTIIDPTLQSRVLLYESVRTPFNQFYPYFLYNQSLVYPNGDPIDDKNIISFNINMWFGIEWFDQWEFQIAVISRKGEQVNLIYRPTGQYEYGPEFIEGRPGDIFTGMYDPPGYLFQIGRQYQDGTWHLVVRDLDRDVAVALGYEMDDIDRDGFGIESGFGPGESRIVYIMFKGYQFRVDNIAFHDRLSDIINHPPKLQRIGPQFAEIFVPYSFIITANDIDLSGGSSDQRLEFLATVGGYGYQGVQTSDMIYRIKEDPNDPENFLICDNDDPACISNKILLHFIPQVFEDLIITIRVVDEGGLSDIETFPLSVVNYPIVNNPPYFEEIENDVYVLGTNEGFFVKEFICYDQDREDIPGTVEEPGNITYTALIDGSRSYRYGPWLDSIIPSPCKPEIRFSPKFEGLHTIQIIATDQRGLSAITDFNLIVVNQGTWLNHPPILCEDIDSPQIAKAGRTFIIPVEFFDPDGDMVYYSCNIGSVTEMKEGFGITSGSTVGSTTGVEKYGRYTSGAIYTLTTHWPGRYLIQIVAFDIRGGYAIVEFILDVEPWWTF
ncbi:MAG: hypothetical protein ACMUIU_02845 [bacterium]